MAGMTSALLQPEISTEKSEYGGEMKFQPGTSVISTAKLIGITNRNRTENKV